MTAAIDVHHFSGPEDLAHHAAQRWLGAGSPDFQSVALSGGRIAAAFFAAAAKLAVADPNAANPRLARVRARAKKPHLGFLRKTHD